MCLLCLFMEVGRAFLDDYNSISKFLTFSSSFSISVCKVYAVWHVIPVIPNDRRLIHLPGLTGMKGVHLPLCILDSHPCKETLASAK